MLRTISFKRTAFLIFMALPCSLSASEFDTNIKLAQDAGTGKEKLAYSNKALELWKSEYGGLKLASAYCERGSANHFLSEFENAVADYDKCEELAGLGAGWGVPLHVNRATSYLHLKNFNKALADFTEAVNLSKASDPTPYIGICRIYELAGKHKEAMEQCRNALKLNPNDDDAYSVLGIIYYRMGDHKKALVHFNKALETAPLNNTVSVAKYETGKCGLLVRYYSLIGWDYYAQNKTETAKKYFNRSFNCSHEYWEAHLGLALVNNKKNDLKNAATWFKSALKLNPKINEMSYYKDNVQFMVLNPKIEKDIREVVDLYQYEAK